MADEAASPMVMSRRPWGAPDGHSSGAPEPAVRVIREAPSRYGPQQQQHSGLSTKTNCVNTPPADRVLVARNFNRTALSPEHAINKLCDLRPGSAGTASQSVERRNSASSVRPTYSRAAAPKGDGVGASGQQRIQVQRSVQTAKAPSTTRSSTGLILPPPKRGMPSARLRQSTSNPFAKLGHNATPFSAAYAAGNIPCRIYHGSVKHSLTWTTPPELLPTFDPLLVQCAEGLRETQYPHHFVACQAFSEMLLSPGSLDKVLPLLPRIVPAIRLALLGGSNDKAVMQGALCAVQELAEVVGAALVPHMKPILIQISKKMFDRRCKTEVVETLQALERNGGEAMLALVKAKVPSYAPLGCC